MEFAGDMESMLEEILKKNTQTCTHTHTCNLPGPDNHHHTHTCYHTHTQVISTDEEEPQSHKSNKRRTAGNKEAVRKYREKKKARTTFLEEEVQNLRSINQQLVKQLQGQADLEAEVARLKGILLQFKVKIDCELGSFPYEKTSSRNWHKGDCNAQGIIGDLVLPCDGDIPCEPLRNKHMSTMKQGGTYNVADSDCHILKGRAGLECHSYQPEGIFMSSDCIVSGTVSSTTSMDAPHIST